MILASMNACNVCSETLLNFSPKFLGSDECLKSELKKKKKTFSQRGDGLQQDKIRGNQQSCENNLKNIDKSYETEIDDRRLNRLVQRKGKYNEKYKVIIKTISKERYLLQ